MAKMILKRIEYPRMTPQEFVDAGVIATGAAVHEVMAVAYPRSSFINWLYSKRPCPPDKQERLHRIAVDLGWVKDKQ